jgi:hypothetical protein
MPTEAEVRALMKRHSGDSPTAPECVACKRPMFIDYCSSSGWEFKCKCGKRATRPYNLRDDDILAVCEDWLRLKADTPYTQLGNGLFEAIDIADAVRNAEELHNLERTDAFIQVWSEQKRRIEQLEAENAKLQATNGPNQALNAAGYDIVKREEPCDD